MLEAAIFDADGTLFDVTALQHEALSRALARTGWEIGNRRLSPEMSSAQKLQALSELRSFPTDWHEEIHLMESEHLSQVIEERLQPCPGARKLLLALLRHGLGACVVSPMDSTQTRGALARLGLSDLVEGVSQSAWDSLGGFRSGAEAIATRVGKCVAIVGGDYAAQRARESGVMAVVRVAGFQDLHAGVLGDLRRQGIGSRFAGMML
jgi:beta-phosphoglucomutase-like phosphatase (HAD superfamily)